MFFENESDVLNNLNNLDLLNEIDIMPSVSANTESIPIVPICFVKGSKVLTDQGLIEIQNIDIHFHTIREKKIVAITKTKLSQDFLVQIKKHSLYKNVPNECTQMSPNHKLLYNSQMISAKDLIGKVIGIEAIPYNNETLYNVLLETHSKMIVNNLISETLDPMNIIGVLYNSALNPDKKKNIS